MKRENFGKNISSLAIVMASVVFMLSLEAFAEKPGKLCKTQKCLEDKTKLVELGYDPSVAERIAVFRPGLAHLIISPEISVHPENFMQAMEENHASKDLKWFESQVQDRNPITVYRGMTFSEGEKFDPTYFFKGDFPIIDPRIFTSDSLKTALGYANGQGKNGLLLRMQIPKFMLYERKPGPYGLVYFRDIVPNDLLFVNGVTSISYRPDEERDEQLATVVFEALKDEDSRILQVPLVQEDRINSNGGFQPTRSWTDSICNVKNHRSFKKIISRIPDKRDADQFRSFFETLGSENQRADKALIQELPRLEQAERILAQVPFISMGSAHTASEMEELYIEWTKESVQQCLRARKMWLTYIIDEIERKRFLNTHSALHGMCEDTPESKLIKEMIKELRVIQEIKEKDAQAKNKSIVHG